jgi:hypothetical protein
LEEVQVKKQTIATLFVLLMLGIFSISAAAQSTHSVWTNQHGFIVRDATNGCQYSSLSDFKMAASWTEPSPPTYPTQAHFRGVTKAIEFSPTCVTRTYDFTLIITTSTTVDEIKGRWRVLRDGVTVCNNCTGKAYLLSQAAGVGNSYKVYIDDPVFGLQTWLYAGAIDVRKDF